MWQQLQVLDLEVHFEALDPVTLPFFRENALRAALGTALRRVVCSFPKRSTCEGCQLENICPYGKLIFFSQTQRNTRKGNVLPFTAYFTKSTPMKMESGQLFCLNLRLFGTAVNYFPYFYFALEEMAHRGIGVLSESGKRGRLALRTIELINPRGFKIPLISTNFAYRTQKEVPTYMLKDYIESVSDLPDKINHVRIKTLSPLRIKHRGHLTDHLDFHILMRAVLRRLSSLYLFTYGTPLELNYREIVSLSENIQIERIKLRWHDYHRYSKTQQMEMKIGGVVGEVVYRGQLHEFYPFLKAGELLSVGRSISFGFGRYELNVEGD